MIGHKIKYSISDGENLLIKTGTVKDKFEFEGTSFYMIKPDDNDIFDQVKVKDVISEVSGNISWHS